MEQIDKKQLDFNTEFQKFPILRKVYSAPSQGSLQPFAVNFLCRLPLMWC